MNGEVSVSFRGIERREELVRSARAWSAAISDGLPPSSVVARVSIHRCAPEWGASTTVQVDLAIDGREITEFARCQDPHDAVQASFIAIAKRLRPRSHAVRPIDMPRSIRGWHRDGSAGPSRSF